MNPIQGIRVIEIANFITGPYAGMLLADLGAEVIKVEHPEGGDPFRAWSHGTYSPQFRAYNRGKKSLTLDLKSTPGRKILRELVSSADVLIENFRPGIAERLGFGFSRLEKLNPRLVYCSISGFGETGPYSGRPAYDTVGQGYSGLLGMLTQAAQPRAVGPAFSDSITGIFACYGIMAALLAREKSGLGQKVELSMLSATLGFLVEPAVAYLSGGKIHDCFTRPRISQVFTAACSDGKLLAVHLSSPAKFWESLTDAIGLANLRSDPRFVTRDKRIDNYESLAALIENALRTKPRIHWLQELDRYDVPCTPIYDMSEVFDDPQVKHLGLEVHYHHPKEGPTRSVRSPVALSKTELEKVSPPPALGEHSEAIIRELGYDLAELRLLRAEGVI